MKIKKVEIDAFRIFEKVENATFDFTLEDGEAANFISLYAPNGFGKTSFYDAVEWCMTDNIQRFWQNEGITNEALSALEGLSTDGKVNLLKNTNAPADKIPFVRIFTDKEDFNRKLKPHGNRKNDIKKKDDFEKPGFREVMLSQEWISAFLKESDGISRYKIFMKNPDLKDLDDYYKQLHTVISANYEKIENLNGEINILKEKVQQISEGNLLETINNAITALNAKGEDVKAIEFSATDKDSLDFENRIQEKITAVNSHLAQLKLKIENLNLANSGDENLIGLNGYFESEAIRTGLETEIRETNLLLEKFSQIQKVKNELITKGGQLASLSLEKENLNSLISQYPEYERINSLVIAGNEKQRQSDEKLNTIQSQLNELRQKQAVENARGETISRNLLVAEQKLTGVPEFKENYSFLKNKISETDQEIKQYNTNLERFANDKKSIESIIAEYKEGIEKVKNEDFHVLISTPSETINGMRELQNRKMSAAGLLENEKQVNLRIESQQSLNAVLNDFIAKGLELVNARQSNECPLCLQRYESYDELAKKITSNNFLSGTMRDLLNERTSIQNKILKLNEEIAKESQTIIQAYLSLIRPEEERLSTLWNNIKSGEKNRNELQQENSKNRARLLELETELGSLNLDEYGAQVVSVFNQLEDQRKILFLLVEEFTGKINASIEQLNITTSQFNATRSELDAYKLNKSYVQITEWFRTNFQSEINVNSITNFLLNNSERQAGLILEITTLNNSINSFNEELKTYNDLELNDKQLVAERRRLAVLQQLSTYENFVKQQFNLDMKIYLKDAVTLLFAELLEGVNKEIKGVSELHTEYVRLSEYNKNLLPFLQSEKDKQDLAAKQTEVDYLNKTLGPFLNNEKSELKKYLELRISNFFYTPLINELYTKIDPHPDFRAVDFQANFELENPSLDVFVIDNTNKQTLIPNLYFSTAQINILSLSIFLASAINSKEYDCIFVDDPIQSMDSINILSTIDLLRSIVVNMGKQIILSTHDENFHKLLQKKIPGGLFKSKFLELETFGKVKNTSKV